MIQLDSVRNLELDALLAHLVDLCATPLGVGLVDTLTPFESPERALLEARRIEDMRLLIEQGRDVELRVGPELPQVLDALDKVGIVLHGEEAVLVAQLIESALGATRLLAAADAEGSLAGLRRDLPSLPELGERLVRSVDGDGSVLDGASPELADIRRRRRVARQRVDHSAERFLAAHPDIGDGIVTTREDRTVVSIRSDASPSRFGIVHGRSSSGATLFVEPFELVELNNAAVCLYEDEQQEITRVLGELSRLLAGRADELREAALLVANVDYLRARSRLRQRLGEGMVELARDGGVRLEAARHPLLVLGGAGDSSARKVVPIDIEIAAGTTIVITGPNTGGKTVALKTVGLAALSFACGLPVSARRAWLPLFSSLHVDIGDPQSIAQSLSTFSGHLKRVATALGNLESPALVLLDELGAGTDPREGGALGVAVAERLREAGATSLLTSHHEALKRYALATPGVRSAAVAFDAETLSPTYELLLDRTGSSNALAIAERLGLPPEVLAHARRLLAGEESEVERLLGQLEASAREHDRARVALGDRERALESESQALEIYAAELHRRAAELHDRERGERRRLRAAFDARLALVVADLRSEAGKLLDGLALSATERRRQEERFQLQLGRASSSAAERAPEPALIDDRSVTGRGTGAPVRIGDVVRVSPFGVTGALVELTSGEAVVEIAGKRLKVSARALDPVATRGDETAIKRVTASVDPRSEWSAELNIIGMTVDDAIMEVEKFLDAAILAVHDEVRIIHGHGTGRLRTGIREHLRRHPQVASFASETDGGVTRVVLAG